MVENKKTKVRPSRSMARKRSAVISGEAVSDAERIRREFQESQDVDSGIRLVHPNQIAFNPKINPRPPALVTDESTRGLYEEIKAQGQLTPIQLRPAPKDSDRPYELIYGSRRLHVCARLGIQVRALVSTMDDVTAIISAVGENAERDSLALVHNARAIARFRNEFDDINVFAKAFNMSRRSAYSTLSMGETPETLIALFPKAENITTRLMSKLAGAIKKQSPDAVLREQLDDLAAQYLKKFGNKITTSGNVASRLYDLLGITQATQEPITEKTIRHKCLISGTMKSSGNELTLKLKCNNGNDKKALIAELDAVFNNPKVSST